MKKITNTLLYELPKPKTVWSGVIAEDFDDVPARIVLTYVWWSEKRVGSDGKKKREWKSRPEFILEIGANKDAMGDWFYSQESCGSLPNSFFKEVCKIKYELPTPTSLQPPKREVVVREKSK